MDINEAIAAFGGTGKMAKRFGVGPSAVSNWKTAGRFPDRLHYRIAKAAEEEGIKLPASLFEPGEAA